MKVTSLTHNGVLFPPEYERSGSSLTATFSSLAEEMLWHWAAKKETDYVKDKVIIKNFWRCLKPELPKEWQVKKFPEDFSAIIDSLFNINQTQKAEKALYRKEHKKEIEAEKAALKEQYGYAIVNGKKQQRDAYLVEGPGIILTRGASPIKGCWKYRTVPEDVIINYIGPKGSEPKAPAGHHWKEVVQNHNAFLTYHYYVKVGDMTERIKRGRFAAASDINKKSDEHKYEKAQKLASEYDEIMSRFAHDSIHADDLITREAALISYLVSVTAIRIGNEKDEKTEAMTVGMSTLLVENMEINGTTLSLNFLGKDSVPYKNDIEVPEDISKALSVLLKNRKSNEKVFDVSSADVGAYMHSIHDYLTPKLFRTAQGTKLLAEELQKHPCDKNMTLTQKKEVYNKACLEVSKKLNHQKAVAKNYKEQIGKADERIEKAKEANAKTQERAKEQLKKIRKDIKTAKSLFEGDKLKEKLAQLKERKEKIEARIARSNERVEKAKFNKEFKKETKNIAIGTAKTAYSSPKVAYSWCKDNDVDISFIYTKTLQERFEWAANTPKTYWKKYPNA